MNMEEFEGKWEQVKGQVKEKWGKFTNDDMTVIKGKQEQLLGKLRERYGFTESQAKAEFGTFMKNCKCGSEASTGSKSQDCA